MKTCATACVLAAFALATAGFAFAGDKAAPAAAAAPAKAADTLVGKALPKVDLSKAVWGEDKMPAMAGKIVVIDVWTAGCYACTLAMPHNTALYKEHAKDGLVVMGLCSTATADSVKQFEKKQGVAYPSAFTGAIKDDIKKAWHVSYYPYFIVVDRKGVVRGAGLDQAGAAAMAKALLKEQPAAK